MTTAQLQELSTKSLLNAYNELADKPVKRFKDRTTAINRVNKLLVESKMTIDADGNIVPLIDPDHKVDPAKIEAAKQTINKLAEEAAANAKGREGNVVQLDAGTKSKRAQAAEKATPTPAPAGTKRQRVMLDFDAVYEQTGDTSKMRNGVPMRILETFNGKFKLSTIIKKLSTGLEVKSGLYKTDPEAYLVDYVKWMIKEGALTKVVKKEAEA